MSRVFVDTSAVYALLVASDANHHRAVRVFEQLQSRGAPLVTTSYVLVETYALLQSRVGLAAVTAFRDDVQPLMQVSWVDEALHERALGRLLARGEAGLSLVDAVSFELIRDEGLDEVFVYDGHFEREGFAVLS